MTTLLLAGDVGGTKTVLTALASDPRSPRRIAEATYESRRFDGLEPIIEEFLGSHGLRKPSVRLLRACFSVAGPVGEGEALITNLGWRLRGDALAETFGLEHVDLVNDLQATAYAVPWLPATQLHTLQEGAAVPDAPRAVIAPGTGLGEAFLVRRDSRWEALASEGGHANFAPADEAQLEMLRFLQQRIGHVSYEQVCSGIGIPNIYRFLKETGAEREPDWLAARLALADDPTPIIGDAALGIGAPACRLCARTIDLFVAVLASEAGNMALRLLCSGGVYVGGGIPPRLLSFLDGERFVRAFRSKGRFTSLMSAFPVHVILDPRAALLGAVQYAIGSTD
jgi:glucokinase